MEISSLDGNALIRGSRCVGVVKHSLVIAGHRTSVSLETAFWDALEQIAAQEDATIAVLATRVDAGRGRANLSSALRVYALEWAMRKE